MSVGRQMEHVTGVDVESLGPWLARRGEAVTPPLTAHRVGLGQSNLTYRLEDQTGHAWVLRRPPHGQLLESAHDIAREHRILAGLAGSEVPVPRVVGLTGGGQHLVMEFVHGLVIDRMESAEAASAAVRRRIGPAMVDALTALHAVDVDTVGLGDLASSRPYAERQLRRWLRQLEASRTRETPGLDGLARLLGDRVPPQRETVLVHGDLHIRNVICSPRDGALLAVLDWELSTLGDPLADLGTLLTYWWAEDDLPDGFFAATTLPGFAHRDELAARYSVTTGRDLTRLGFWHVLGVWKVAIIAEGVRRRALDQPTNLATGEPPSTTSIDHLTDQAWRLVSEYGL